MTCGNLGEFSGTPVQSVRATGLQWEPRALSLVNVTTVRRVEYAGAGRQSAMLLGADAWSVSPQLLMQRMLTTDTITPVDMITYHHWGRGQCCTCKIIF